MKRACLFIFLAFSLTSIIACGEDNTGGDATDYYNIGGTVSGLTGTLLLQNKESDYLVIDADGPFTFTSVLADGSAYVVDVLVQPSGQECSVSGGTGTIRRADVIDISVTCSQNTYTVGGTVSGLSGSFVLQNNESDYLEITADGPFTFAATLADGNTYDVKVLNHPAGQTCSVSGSTGNITSANVTDVSVACSQNTYTVGGMVSGLLGTGLVLQNNDGYDLPVDADGPFTFATALADGSAYEVTVLIQPSGQACSVTGGTGTMIGADVTDVSVICSLDIYTVGGTVSGLSGSFVLQNNESDYLVINSNGPFTFATVLANGSAYDVTVLTHPSGQNCSVSSGSGTITGADVTDVYVICSLDIYTVGGTVSGLSGSFVLQNNGSDYLVITEDGPFAFAASLADGRAYDVTVLAHPSGQACAVSSGTGTIAGADVTDVYVKCYAPGRPDRTFDGDGVVVHDKPAGGSGEDFGQSITTDSQGRILVTGYSNKTSEDSDMVIWRYNADGTLDNTFDGDGIVTHDNAAGGTLYFDGGSSITNDSQGRILVTGFSATDVTPNYGNYMTIWRYNADGTLDTTFDGDGIVVYYTVVGSTGRCNGSSITTDSQGRILVTGTISNIISGNEEMAIWRYNADGSPDTTFNGDGIVTHDSAAGGAGRDYGNSIITDSQGRILVTGYSYLDTGTNDYEIVIWRYNADGTLDTTFDGDGFVVHANAGGGNDSDYGFSITTDSQGRILVTGYGRNAAGNDSMVVLRYNADGTPDTTFDGDGIVVYDNAAGGGNGADYGYSIATDTQGRILVGGVSVGPSYTNDMAVWRYNADGTLDTTFGVNGVIVHHNAAGGSVTDHGRSIATDSQGRILVTGYSWNSSGNFDMAIWRALPE